MLSKIGKDFETLQDIKIFNSLGSWYTLQGKICLHKRFHRNYKKVLKQSTIENKQKTLISAFA